MLIALISIAVVSLVGGGMAIHQYRIAYDKTPLSDEEARKAYKSKFNPNQGAYAANHEAHIAEAQARNVAAWTDVVSKQSTYRKWEIDLEATEGTREKVVEARKKEAEDLPAAAQRVVELDKKNHDLETKLREIAITVGLPLDACKEVRVKQAFDDSEVKKHERILQAEREDERQRIEDILVLLGKKKNIDLARLRLLAADIDLVMEKIYSLEDSKTRTKKQKERAIRHWQIVLDAYMKELGGLHEREKTEDRLLGLDGDEAGGDQEGVADADEFIRQHRRRGEKPVPLAGLGGD